MKIYICKIRVLGMPFATTSEARAHAWEQEDKSHYFEEMDLEDI